MSSKDILSNSKKYIFIRSINGIQIANKKTGTRGYQKRIHIISIHKKRGVKQ
jgi:hypothetical protein